jgi:16S rRNA processing protein RimM
MTIRVASGDAERWTGLTKVLLAYATGVPERGAEAYGVASARAYRDRLVLKLEGVDDAGAAAALRGREVLATDEEVPPLPERVFYQQRLLGLTVVDEAGESLGVVEDVTDTAGAALLVVRRGSGKSLLVPMAEEIVLSVHLAEGRIRVRLPEGLMELEEL